MLNCNSKNFERNLLVIVFFICILTAYLANSVSVAVPNIAKSLGMNNIVQNWVLMIFLFTIAATSLPFGKFAGSWGLKKSIKISLFLIIIGAIGSVLSYSQYILLFFRVFQACGVTLLSISAIALISTVISSENRGKALGISIAGIYVGIMFSPLLAGSLNYNFGWQSIFIIAIPYAIVLYGIICSIGEEWITFKDKSFDKKESLIWIIGIILLIFGFSSLNKFFGIISFIFGLILIVSFIFIESKSNHPIVDISLFKNINFLTANIVGLLVFFAVFFTSTMLSYYFQYILGFNSQTTGLFIILTPIIAIIFSPLTGRLSDKFNPLILVIIGIIFISVALGIFSCLNENTPLYLIVIALFFEGLGSAFFYPPNTNLMMGSVPKNEMPTASALSFSVKFIGQSLSVGMLTLVFSIIMSNVPIIPKYYSLLIQSLNIVSICGLIICIITILVSIVGIKYSSKG